MQGPARDAERGLRASLTVIVAWPAAGRRPRAAAPRLWPPILPAPRASAAAPPGSREQRPQGSAIAAAAGRAAKGRGRQRGAVGQAAGGRTCLFCSSAIRASSHSRLPGRGAAISS